MKALAAKPRSNKSIEMVDYPEPQINDSGSLIRTYSVGIDGTDIEILSGKYGEAPPDEELLILGHEAVGRVENTGKKVSHLKAGDFVVPTVRRKCEKVCCSCSQNQPDACTTDKFKERGIKQENGYMAEYFSEEPENLVLLPDHLVEFGSLVEPMSVAQKAIDHSLSTHQRYAPEPSTALVLGAGPLGLLATLLFSLRGIDVYALDLVDENSLKAEIVRKVGANYVDGKITALENFAAKFGKQPDVVLEATGNSKVAFAAISALNRGGVLCLLGVTAGKKQENICIDCVNNDIVLNSKAIIGSLSSNSSHFISAIKAMDEANRRFPDALNEIITEKYDFSDYKAAFEKKGDSHIKTVLYLNSH